MGLVPQQRQHGRNVRLAVGKREHAATVAGTACRIDEHHVEARAVVRLKPFAAVGAHHTHVPHPRFGHIGAERIGFRGVYLQGRHLGGYARAVQRVDAQAGGKVGHAARLRHQPRMKRRQAVARRLLASELRGEQPVRHAPQRRLELLAEAPAALHLHYLRLVRLAVFQPQFFRVVRAMLLHPFPEFIVHIHTNVQI